MEGWQVNRKKPAKICHYAEKGEACMRAICNYYHPVNPTNGLGFQWDQLREPPPPLGTEPRIMTSTQRVPERVSVIVMNKTMMKSQEIFPELSKSLKGLALD